MSRTARLASQKFTSSDSRMKAESMALSQRLFTMRGMPRLALGPLLQRNFEHTMNPRPRRLRLVGHNGEFLAQQGIQ